MFETCTAPLEGVYLGTSFLISKEESTELTDKASRNDIMPVFVPQVYEKGVLSHIKQGDISLSDYLKGYSSNITPATDDNPYFYNFTKDISLTLLILLIMLILFNIVLFSFLVADNKVLKPAIYFSLLGIGYMMLETPLIQRFILYLGHPV